MVLRSVRDVRPLCVAAKEDPNQITKALLWLYSLESWLYHECNRACREEHGLTYVGSGENLVPVARCLVKICVISSVCGTNTCMYQGVLRLGPKGKEGPFSCRTAAFLGKVLLRNLL